MNVRRPDATDLEAVLELMRVTDIAVAGDSDWTASELSATWADLDLTRDAWIFELDGRVAGYADFFAKGARLNGDGYVHPEFRGRGIGSEILRLTEERAREEEQQRGQDSEQRSQHDQLERVAERELPDLKAVVARKPLDAVIGRQEQDAHGESPPEPADDRPARQADDDGG